MIGPADRGTVGATTGAVVGAARPAALNTGVPMAERGEVVDEGFLRRYRELLDQEAAAFDELEHSYEDGDRAHYERVNISSIHDSSHLPVQMIDVIR